MRSWSCCTYFQLLFSPVITGKQQLLDRFGNWTHFSRSKTRGTKPLFETIWVECLLIEFLSFWFCSARQKSHFIESKSCEYTFHQIVFRVALYYTAQNLFSVFFPFSIFSAKIPKWRFKLANCKYLLLFTYFVKSLLNGL